MHVFPFELKKYFKNTFITFVIVELIVVLLHSFLHLTLLENVLLGALIISIAFNEEVLRHYFMNKVRIKKYNSILEKLFDLKLENVRPIELENYFVTSIHRHLDNLGSLSTGTEFTCSYAEQIGIANAIAKSIKHTFWATTRDRPSRIWIEGVDYFQTLLDENGTDTLKIHNDDSTFSEANIKSRSRVVVLKYDELLEDYKINSTSFNDFIEWHHSNNWGLKFYSPKSIEELEYLIQNKVIGDDKPLTDFLIKDSEIVFGRLDERVNRVYVKLLQDKIPDANNPTINSYIMLFTILWRKAITPEQILRRIELDNRKKIFEEEIIKEFRPEFKDCDKGLDYIKKVSEKIENANEYIRAVDIADIKNEISIWAGLPEYQFFLDASINAAKKKKNVYRIYVLNKLDSLQNKFIPNIILKQLECDIKIGVLLYDDCLVQNLTPDDYIIVDENFGFHLGNKNFDADDLSYIETLLPRPLVKQYINLFDELWNSSAINKFEGQSSIENYKDFVDKNKG